MRRIVRGLLMLLLISTNAVTAVSAQDDSYELTVGARLCGAPDEVGNTCQPLDGLTISVADETGTNIGSCVTEPYDGAGSTCSVSVPLGTTVTVSVSPDDIPDNTTMSVVNASITVPDDPAAPQDAVPTFQFIDDSTLEQTVAAPVDNTDGDSDSAVEVTESEQESEAPQGDTIEEVVQSGSESDDPSESEPDGAPEPADEETSWWEDVLDDTRLLLIIGVVALIALALPILLMGQRTRRTQRKR